MLAVLIALLVIDPSPSPKPRPTPVSVLEGRVQGPDGKAIAGALVVARSRSAAWTDRPLSTNTDATGAFRLALKSGGAHDAWAHARGLAVAKREDVRPGTPLVFRLESGGAIEGIVRDGSAAPVEGARVETEANEYAPDWVPDAGTATTNTDRNGRFRLTGLDRRPHTVLATARGYGRAQQQGVHVGRRVELVLVPGASVSGVVVDAQGRALADVVVRLEAQQRFQRSPSTRTSDARGRYGFDGLSAGSYALMARHRELGLALSPGIEVGAEGEVRRDIILLPGVAVTGRLVDPEEHPVSGRVAVGEIAGEPAPRGVADALSADARDDGRFRIEGVPLGPAALTLNSRGFATRRADFEARSGPAGTDLGDLTMDPGLRLRGRVRTSAGTPIAEARIVAHQRLGGGRMLDATSDDDGSFVIGGMQPGTWWLSVRARGFAVFSATVDAGANDLDLVLDPSGSIAGTVVDEKGAAVTDFRVRAEVGDQGDTEDAFSPADGRFVLEGVGEGRWTLSVTARGYGQAAVSDVVVRPGRVSDVGRIRITRGATIRGQVVTVDDSPVGGATVRSLPTQPMGSYWGDDPTASSDASGVFELTGVPPGTVDVTAMHPSYADTIVRGVEADPTRPSDIRIVLGRGGRIEGTARRRDGAPLVGAYVMVRTREGSSFSLDSFRSAVAPDGAFSIDHVPTGPMRVVLMASSGGMRFTSTVSRDVDVHEGETLTVDLLASSILVSGHVTRAGVPVSGARVALRSSASSQMAFSVGGEQTPPTTSSGPGLGAGVTDEDGLYQLLMDASGAAWATVEVGSPAEHHRYPNIDVPDSDSFTLDFALGATVLSGTVVDAETSSAVAEAWVTARRRDGEGPRGSSTTGLDGRFQIEVEPGEYNLFAGKEGYADVTIDIAPGPSGLSDIVVPLEKGLDIRGQLVDARGNGVAGTYVSATSGDDNSSGAATMANGYFRITGLKASSYTLFAEAGGMGFVTRTGVTAPAEGITLQLSPGGRVRVRVLAADGSPASGANVGVVEVDGRAVQAENVQESNAEGIAEMAAPAGVVTLSAATAKRQATGRVVVAVPEGETVPAEIALRPPEKPTR